MNCKVVRDQLLQTERPERPADDLAAHLGQCSPCRQWHQRLVQLERLVPQLPVPPSRGGKAGLFKRLAGEQIAPRPSVRVVRRPSRWKAIFRSPAMPPAALAASLLLFAGLWWHLEARSRVTPQPQPQPMAYRPPPRDLLLADLLQHNIDLVGATSAEDRVKYLAAMADRLHGATQTLADKAEVEDLAALAKLYEKVVRDGIVPMVPRVRSLGKDERRKLLTEIADRLTNTVEQARQRAQEAPTTAFANQWTCLAAAAQDGTDKIRTLLGEEAKK
jgi:hypothetical protein